MSEAGETRLKRIRIRSWRRGTREMDLILGGFADAALGDLGPEALDAFEDLLEEDDDALYRWVSGGERPPERHDDILGRVRAFVGAG